MSTEVEAKRGLIRFDVKGAIGRLREKLTPKPKSLEQLILESAGIAIQYQDSPHTVALELSNYYRKLEKCLSHGLGEAKNKAGEEGKEWDGEIVFEGGVVGPNAKQSFLVNGPYIAMVHAQGFDRGLYREELKVKAKADWENGHSIVYVVSLARTNIGEHIQGQRIIMEEIILCFSEPRKPFAINVFRKGIDGKNINLHLTF